MISIDDYKVLIDTSPDLRAQLIKAKVKNINEVFYTHMHADQTHGINELRLFYLLYKKKINVYANRDTLKYLKNTFSYCFTNTHNYPAFLKLNNLKKKHTLKDKIIVEPFTVDHGKVKSILYKINNSCAYVSDVNKIYKKDYKHLEGLKYLVIDCLRYNPHPSHFCYEEVIKLAKILKPKKTVLINMTSEFDYDVLKSKLPKNITPGFDGMSFLL